ncbi:MAG TPA: ABC transporter permease [Kiloniellales bacterium]
MAPVLRTVLQRLWMGVITLFVVSIIIFATIEMLPGDFAKAILGQSATPETVAAFQRQIGLDRMPVERYVIWIGNVLQGDFGVSFSSVGALGGGSQRTVVSLIAPRLGNTLFLAGLTAAIAVPLSLTLGMLAALYRNSIFDRTVNFVTLTSISVPEFFVAYILMLFLAIKFPIFYSLANITADTPLLERIARSALPVMTLVLVITAHMMRMTRAAIINLLASPFIEMARLKGISPHRIIYRHALPNAWAPIATVIALNLAYLIVGVVVVEVVFVYPGVGQLMVDAVSARDIPVVQACALIFAMAYILLNLLADIVSIVTNPRLLHPR